MAIYRPKAIDDAPEGLERSGGRCRRDFLASRGMGVSPGEESRVDSVAAQTIEAQPVFGQIEPSKRPRASRAEPQVREKMAILGLGKRSKRFGVGKETKEGKRRYRRYKANCKRAALAPYLCRLGRNQRHVIEVFQGRSRLHFAQARWPAFRARL